MSKTQEEKGKAIDLEKQPPIKEDMKVKEAQHQERERAAKVETHGENPPKGKNLPNLKR